MTVRRPAGRRLAALAVLALPAALLAPLAVTAPAAAAGVCTDETWPQVPVLPGLPIAYGDGCDDATAPDTTLVARPVVACPATSSEPITSPA